MTQNYAEVLKLQSEKLVAPIVKLNKLNVANLEKLAALQVACLSTLTDLGVAQLKAVVEVRDAEGAKAVAEKQAEYVRTFGEKLVADSKEMVEMAKTYSADVQKIAQEGADVVAKAA